ncbi:helix-turn-helix transcriptional regulator [Tenacibaculum halocynthiae]|uniref:helix-turn-helix transcriptional regulator n=1 Tax=Tenacibaculum halocynthiae TaxID=1254437 RepID=UPI003D65F95E
MPSAKFEISRQCKICNKEFFAKTINSRYCSPKCSKSAYARKKKEENLKQLKIAKALKISNEEEYISVVDVVALYDVSRDAIYRLIRSKKVKTFNLGKRLTKVYRKDLEELFDLRPITETLTAKEEVKTYRLEKEDCYSIGDITEKYGISETSVYMHIRKLSIPMRQIGKYVYAPKLEIDKLYN